MKLLISFVWSLLFLLSASKAQDARLMIPIEHELPVVSTRWSPDGLYLITASLDKTAKIWDFETGKILADLKGHQSELTDAFLAQMDYWRLPPQMMLQQNYGMPKRANCFLP